MEHRTQMGYEAPLMSYAVRSAVLALGFLLAIPASSHADVSHTVARGHTIEAIAHRYRVSAKSIVDANHLKDAKHLKIGENLTIPGVSAPTPKATPKAAVTVGAVSGGGKAKAVLGAKVTAPTKPITYAMRPKDPGVIHARRLATTEDFTIRVNSRRGRQTPTSAKTFETMLRSSGNLAHPIDTRLIALLGLVSNHFGSRKIEVVSGFRPFSPTQHTAHSNHNVGKAIDFRVVGVPNEVVRDYCKTLRNVGVGYYPNSTFVHLDARTTSAFWIDFSKPGEAPRYNSPNVDADEGTSDVAEESHSMEAIVPATAPVVPSANTAPTPIPPPLPGPFPSTGGSEATPPVVPTEIP